MVTSVGLLTAISLFRWRAVASVGPGATAELLVALDDIASIDHTVQLTVADMPNASCICFVRPKARLLSSNAIQ